MNKQKTRTVDRSLGMPIAILFLAATSQANAQSYTFTDLGSGRNAYAINNSGQIVGNSQSQAILWNGNTATYLTPGNDARGINSSGQVAGWSNSSATIWNGTSATQMGSLGGGGGQAYGINDAGQAVGWSETGGSYTQQRQHATVWNGTTASDLGTLGGYSSFAFDINNGGQIVGYSYTANDAAIRGVLWSGATATELGTLGGKDSVAWAINDSGQIVGQARTSGNAWQAALWSGTTAIALDVLGSLDSRAMAINNAGQIVGDFYTAAGAHAAIWNGTAVTDLNTLLDASVVQSGWVLSYAKGINDNGWIVGNATNTISGQSHAFLLTPVPEPETYAMMLAGLGLVMAVVRSKSLNNLLPKMPRKLVSGVFDA